MDDFVDSTGSIKLPYAKVALQLCLWRAPTDNDRIGHIATNWEMWGVRQLSRFDYTIKKSSNRVTISNIWQSSAGIQIKHTQIITPISEGFSVAETVVVPKQPSDLGRVGTVFELSDALDQVVWFGSGPHETYPDRKIGRIQR